MTGDELETTGENSRSEVGSISPVSSFSSPLRDGELEWRKSDPAAKDLQPPPCNTPRPTLARPGCGAGKKSVRSRVRSQARAAGAVGGSLVRQAGRPGSPGPALRHTAFSEIVHMCTFCRHRGALRIHLRGAIFAEQNARACALLARAALEQAIAA